MDITVEELKKKMDRKEDFVLLDIRMKTEVDYAKIPGSIHIPMRDLMAGTAVLDKAKEYIIYCHTGGRSGYLVPMLESKGYKAYNLLGGIDEYSEKIDKTIPSY